MVKSLARPAVTSIAEGFPASTERPHGKPQSILDRLIARMRRWRRIHDYPGGGGDEADCRRIGWLIIVLTSLPFIVGAILLLLSPAIAFATLTHLDPATVGLNDLLLLTALIAAPVMCAWLVWIWLRRPNREDEDA
jgi:hypothetical protein